MHRRIVCSLALAGLIAPLSQAPAVDVDQGADVEYTKAWTGDRFPDGRPKVPDQWLEAKDMSAEEVITSRNSAGLPAYSQFIHAPSDR